MRELTIEFTVSKDGGWTKVYQIRQTVDVSESNGRWQAVDSGERWQGEGASESEALVDWLGKRLKADGAEEKPYPG